MCNPHWSNTTKILCIYYHMVINQNLKPIFFGADKAASTSYFGVNRRAPAFWPITKYVIRTAKSGTWHEYVTRICMGNKTTNSNYLGGDMYMYLYMYNIWKCRHTHDWGWSQIKFDLAIEHGDLNIVRHQCLGWCAIGGCQATWYVGDFLHPIRRIIIY